MVPEVFQELARNLKNQSSTFKMATKPCCHVAVHEFGCSSGPRILNSLPFAVLTRGSGQLDLLVLALLNSSGGLYVTRHVIKNTRALQQGRFHGHYIARIVCLGAMPSRVFVLPPEDAPALQRRLSL